ncbi:DUF6172 family protein [Aliikangiella coralliicola]|uniref:Uncharacterized protein n=1 Tax=Aliikangiella coralliicola TaxID=2592383 RepID=A0A545UC40_9GAMM|nr:DUF6172 family protein [Aliikangiella coralliicola]TQV87041.1 hypothetical protein FLL46_14645 [Aliikangiella coralliicola]
MKKTFELNHPKIKIARMFEAAKHEVKKYLKRERNKKLPEDAGYWDFDCKFGAEQSDVEVIHVTEINKKIDEAERQGLTSFYLEILAKPGAKKRESE